MNFTSPLAFLLLLLLPWIVGPTRFEARKGLPLNTLALLDEKRNWLSKHGPALLRGIAASFLILALAGPQGPGRLLEEKIYGIDMMLALDLSGSMRAEDFQPENRLEAAKKVLRGFIERNRSHRIGLVAFAGKSLTIAPLTTDIPMLLSALDNLGFGTIKEEGTAIGDAVANALYRLKEEGAKSRVIVILTDGQNNSGMLAPSSAASIARGLGVKIYAIAVGRPGGAPVPVPNNFGPKTYLRNPDGGLYLTRVDEKTLQGLSRVAGGAFFRAIDTQGLEEAYRQISRLERSEIATSRHREREDLAWLPLSMAFLALAAAWGLSLGPLDILQVRGGDGDA